METSGKKKKKTKKYYSHSRIIFDYILHCYDFVVQWFRRPYAPTAFDASAGDSYHVGGRHYRRARESFPSQSVSVSLSLSPTHTLFLCTVVRRQRHRRRRNPRVGHRTLPSVVRVLASSRRVGFAGTKISQAHADHPPRTKRTTKNRKF